MGDAFLEVSGFYGTGITAVVVAHRKGAFLPVYKGCYPVAIDIAVGNILFVQKAYLFGR